MRIPTSVFGAELLSGSLATYARCVAAYFGGDLRECSRRHGEPAAIELKLSYKGLLAAMPSSPLKSVENYLDAIRIAVKIDKSTPVEEVYKSRHLRDGDLVAQEAHTPVAEVAFSNEILGED